MIRNREEAAQAAESTKTNVPGTCQKTVREWFAAPSVGDVDGDGRADAEDGFKSEPKSAVHLDRRAPRGTPFSFLGGRNDDGHRAISVHLPPTGEAILRSTDFNGQTKRYQAGVVGNGTVSEVAAAMGVTPVGWSETISGQRIPLAPRPDPEPKPTPVPTRVSKARHLLEEALDVAESRKATKRARKIQSALEVLPKR